MICPCVFSILVPHSAWWLDIQVTVDIFVSCCRCIVKTSAFWLYSLSLLIRLTPSHCNTWWISSPVFCHGVACLVCDRVEVSSCLCNMLKYDLCHYFIICFGSPLRRGNKNKHSNTVSLYCLEVTQFESVLTTYHITNTKLFLTSLSSILGTDSPLLNWFSICTHYLIIVLNLLLYNCKLKKIIINKNVRSPKFVFTVKIKYIKNTQYSLCHISHPFSPLRKLPHIHFYWSLSSQASESKLYWSIFGLLLTVVSVWWCFASGFDHCQFLITFSNFLKNETPWQTFAMAQWCQLDLQTRLCWLVLALPGHSEFLMVFPYMHESQQSFPAPSFAASGKKPRCPSVGFN